VLWSPQALGSFYRVWTNTPPLPEGGTDEFRAVIGTWNGIPTLTVWGKLSWGANPLAESTMGNGIPDGEQPDPAANTVIQVNITSWWADLHNGNDEAAPFVDVSSSPGGTGQTFYDGFGPAQKGSNVSSSSYYVVSVPITTSSQFVYFNISVSDNDSSSGKTWYRPIAVSSTRVDLVGQQSSVSVAPSQRNATLRVTYSVLRVGIAANTLLWAPANNTTLSGAPWGLKRYTGEPDFDLLVLNVSGATTISGIEWAGGQYTYSVPLSAGLNNVLVPRGAFLSSPLGQALINNTNETFRIPGGAGVTFTATDWSSRTETSSSNPVPASSNGWNPSYIRVVSTLSQSQNNSGSSYFGGLPQNGAVEPTVDESLQVQAVFAINVSASGFGSLRSENAVLVDLFGGLILNKTGNLTGNILSVTVAMDTLGLPQNVQLGLANCTLPNSGSYPTPQYQAPRSQSTPWWQAVGSGVCNTIGGFAQWAGETFFHSALWNWMQAAGAYIGYGAIWLSNHLGIAWLQSQFAKGLEILASAMEWAWNQLLSLLKSALILLFEPITSPITSAIDSYASGLGGKINQAWADVNASQPVSPSLIAGYWDVFSGPIFLVALGIGVAVEAALTLTTPFGLEGSFIVPILATLAGAGLGLIHGLPQLTPISSTTVGALQSFLSRLGHVPAIYLDSNLAVALGDLAAGSTALSALLAFYLYNGAVQAAKEGNGWGGVVFAGFIAALSLIALFLELSGNPGLIILAIVCSLFAATVAGIMVGKGASTLIGDPSLADYLTFITLCGGLSAGFDIGRLASE
jgi:hypothetical protein